MRVVGQDAPSKAVLTAVMSAVQMYLEDEERTPKPQATTALSAWRRATMRMNIGASPRTLSWNDTL